MRFVGRLQTDLSEPLYVLAVFNHPTVARLAAHLEANYTQAVRRLTGEALPIPADSAPATRLTPGHIRQVLANFQGVFTASASPVKTFGSDRRPIFILSPPRCGSTLTRVMLGGHPGLFAPPELHLHLLQ